MPAKTVQGSEPLIAILEGQVVPCWERFGLEHLAVTRQTLKQFKAQLPPGAIQAVVKMRIGKRMKLRSARNFNNTSSFVESWTEDNQSVFRYPTLTFVVSGQADFHVADYCLRCPPGHFLLFSDGVPRPTGGRPHLEGEDRAERCTVLWFFAPPGTNSVIAYLCHSQGEKHWGDAYHIVPCPEAIHVFKLALQELQDDTRRHQPLAILSTQTFLHLFVRELQAGRFHQAGKSSAADFGSEIVSPIGQAQRYIKTHLNGRLTAERVAREVFMSRNSFIQHFKRETGETFHAFVTRERMIEAHRLLSEGYWSHAFICQFIGLRPTQFRTQFKQHFGVAPSAFRRAITTNVQNR
jgi:AraC-like DNA-binding protein